jgi:hypothetical protein
VNYSVLLPVVVVLLLLRVVILSFGSKTNALNLAAAAIRHPSCWGE